MALGRREFLGEAVAGVVALALPEEPPHAARLSRRAARALRSAVRGPVFLPRTPGYNRERLVYNTRFDGIRPDAVVKVLDTRDVQAVVRWANRFDVRVVPRSGGHSYAGYSTTANGVVVDLSRLAHPEGADLVVEEAGGEPQQRAGDHLERREGG